MEYLKNNLNSLVKIYEEKIKNTENIKQNVVSITEKQFCDKLITEYKEIILRIKMINGDKK